MHKQELLQDAPVTAFDAVTVVWYVTCLTTHTSRPGLFTNARAAPAQLNSPV